MKTSLFSILLLLSGVNCAAQEFLGPEKVTAGTLATFEVQAESGEVSWCLIPNEPPDCYKVDTASNKLYFASPVTGKYTIIAATSVEGKPQLLSKTFINGENEIKPSPEPTPTPKPEPAPIPPDSLGTWIKTQTPILVKSKNFSQESQLVAGCFAQIVKRIDDGNIKTAQNARTQLQISLTATLAQASQTAVTDWMPFLAELSRRLETELGTQINDLSEVKKMLQIVSDAIKTMETPKAVAAPKQTLQTVDCPSCLVPGTPGRNYRYIISQ